MVVPRKAKVDQRKRLVGFLGRRQKTLLDGWTERNGVFQRGPLCREPVVVGVIEMANWD